MNRAILALISLASLLTACANPAAGSDSMLRTLVEVEYLSDDPTVFLHAGSVAYSSSPWASHPIEVVLATDDYYQELTLPDGYVIEELGASQRPGAANRVVLVTDLEPVPIEFSVDVEPLSPGEHRFELLIPIHLVPNPRFDTGQIDRVYELAVELVYHVFVAESELDYYCARADQLLQNSSADFSPQQFIDEGRAALTDEQLALLETAKVVFDSQFDETGGYLDPGPFFDVIEQICDVRYDERWGAWTHRQ